MLTLTALRNITYVPTTWTGIRRRFVGRCGFLLRNSHGDGEMKRYVYDHGDANLYGPHLRVSR